MASHDGHSTEWHKPRVDAIVDIDGGTRITEPGGFPTGKTNPGFSSDANPETVTSSHGNPVSCKVPITFDT